MNRYVAPALVLLAIVISLVAPWSVVEMQQGTQEFTLNEMMDRDAVDMFWVWISGIGALLVIASAFLRGTMRTRLAQIGSILAVILPIKVLWDGFTREDTPGVTISPGWGLWLALILTVLAIIAAFMMSDDDDVDSNVVRTPQTVEDTDTVIRTERDTNQV
jgi:hypothetical protein